MANYDNIEQLCYVNDDKIPFIKELEGIVHDNFEQDYFQMDNTYPFVVKFYTEQAAKNFIDYVCYEWKGVVCKLDSELNKIVTIEWDPKTLTKIQKSQSYYNKMFSNMFDKTDVVKRPKRSYVRECLNTFEPNEFEILVFDSDGHSSYTKVDGKYVLNFLLDAMNYPTQLDMSDEQKIEYENCFKDEYTDDEVDFAVVEFLKKNYNDLVDCNKQKITKYLSTDNKKPDRKLSNLFNLRNLNRHNNKTEDTNE